MRLLIVRHGQTDWNVAGKVQGSTDIELNETGKEQAKQTAQKLSDDPIDIIITSPLKRARKTAEIINETLKTELIIEEELRERNFGKLEGKTRKEFDFKKLWDDVNKIEYDTVEELDTLFTRVSKLMQRIEKEYKDKTVLLVTHGGITIPIKCIMENIPRGTEEIFRLGIGNCEVLEYNK